MTDTTRIKLEDIIDKRDRMVVSFFIEMERLYEIEASVSETTKVKKERDALMAENMNQIKELLKEV